MTVRRRATAAFLSAAVIGLGVFAWRMSPPLEPITRGEALSLAEKTMANFQATHVLPNSKLADEIVDATSGTRVFVYKSDNCVLQINVTSEGSVDVGGMSGPCPVR
jgi:hypothetical protein